MSNKFKSSTCISNYRLESLYEWAEMLYSCFQINELTIAVNDLRGKFVKPMLKKVSKYDNK